MSTQITPKTFPALHAALLLIETDNGGHLIGTVYPGNPLPPDFEVPDKYLSHIGPGERVLKRMKDNIDNAVFNDFVVGEETDQERIGRAYSENAENKRDVASAILLMNTYFDGWDPDYDRTMGT